MAPSKLSDTDKQAITELYCQPGETTSTLADKFGVSTSTVSRVLKQQLSPEDYERLTQWKRSGERGALDLSFHTGRSDRAQTSASPPPQDFVSKGADIDIDAETDADAEAETESFREPDPSASRRTRKRSTPRSNVTPSRGSDDQLPLQLDAPEAELSSLEPGTLAADLEAETAEITEGDIAADWDDDDLDDADEYEDDDEYEDEEEEDDLEEWDGESEADDTPVPVRQEHLEILPFDRLDLQKACYLVVDRLSELITCPLKEFSELGIIPEEEEQARTLPVFDNHRVARRFSRRNQRIIKIPNGAMLTKTQHYLQAKGITRLLFDGQVYSLN